MIAVRVLGRSDAGKTTLVERLLPALSERGRVASVKSIHHPIEIDTEGKDTHRHRTAGAEHVVGITPTLTATFETRGKDDYESEAAALGDLLGDLDERGFDYVPIEGFSSAASLPAIVVGGETDEDRWITASTEDQETVASVEDATSVDVEALADRIDALDPWTVMA